MFNILALVGIGMVALAIVDYLDCANKIKKQSVNTLNEMQKALISINKQLDRKSNLELDTLIKLTKLNALHTDIQIERIKRNFQESQL